MVSIIAGAVLIGSALFTALLSIDHPRHKNRNYAIAIVLVLLAGAFPLLGEDDFLWTVGGISLILFPVGTIGTVASFLYGYAKEEHDDANKSQWPAFAVCFIVMALIGAIPIFVHGALNLYAMYTATLLGS